MPQFEQRGLCLLLILTSTLPDINEDGEDGEGGHNPCLSSPCGLRAQCHNFSSGSFICKCDRNGDYPFGIEGQVEKYISLLNLQGNPYIECLECDSNSGCESGQICYQGSCQREQKFSCGQSQTRRGRIVGGDIAKFGQWPWQASLMKYKEGKFINFGSWEHKCGAILISDKWVATAAHCVLVRKPNINPEMRISTGSCSVQAENVTRLRVRLGELNMQSEGEPIGHLDKELLDVIFHPRFDNLTKENDIALLQVSSDGLKFQVGI